MTFTQANMTTRSPLPPFITVEQGITIRRDGSTRREAWAKQSRDGRWLMRRLEEPGTPWLVTCRDVVGWSMLASSEGHARRSVEGQLGLDLSLAMRRIFLAGGRRW